MGERKCDPSIHDPFARQMVTAAGFASMTEKVMEVADKVCNSKLVLIQEGGYSVRSLLCFI
jgi:acetoin utilization deacetylase AcuC-like enzyme